MMLEPGEAILWETIEQARECLQKLSKEGYLTLTTGDPQDVGPELLRYGVRRSVHNPFPSCVAFIDEDIFNDLTQYGKVVSLHYGDKGEIYHVRWYSPPVEASVEDLL